MSKKLNVCEERLAESLRAADAMLAQRLASPDAWRIWKRDWENKTESIMANEKMSLTPVEFKKVCNVILALLIEQYPDAPPEGVSTLENCLPPMSIYDDIPIPTEVYLDENGLRPYPTIGDVLDQRLGKETKAIKTWGIIFSYGEDIEGIRAFLRASLPWARLWGPFTHPDTPTTHDWIAM